MSGNLFMQLADILAWVGLLLIYAALLLVLIVGIIEGVRMYRNIRGSIKRRPE